MFPWKSFSVRGPAESPLCCEFHRCSPSIPRFRLLLDQKPDDSGARETPASSRSLELLFCFGPTQVEYKRCSAVDDGKVFPIRPGNFPCLRPFFPICDHHTIARTQLDGICFRFSEGHDRGRAQRAHWFVSECQLSSERTEPPVCQLPRVFTSPQHRNRIDLRSHLGDLPNDRSRAD